MQNLPFQKKVVGIPGMWDSYQRQLGNHSCTAKRYKHLGH